MSKTARCTMDSANFDNVTMLNNGLSQFEISKQIYFSGILNRINLSMSAKMVLIALANHYNPQKSGMFPSQKFISEQLGVSLKSVERAIKELKAANLVVYVTKKVNCYYFTAKFFDEIKLSDEYRQIVGSDTRQNVAQTDNHEQKKNRVFQKTFSAQRSNPAPAKTSQPKGMDYQPAVLDFSRDEETPWNDIEVAKQFICELKASMDNAFVKQRVQKILDHWRLLGHELDFASKT